MHIRVLGGPIVYQQVYDPTVDPTGIQYRHIQPFGVRVSQVYNPVEPPDTTKGIQYFYHHAFRPLYYPNQIDAEYEIVIPPEPYFPGGGGLFRLNRNIKKDRKFDDRDLIDIVQIMLITGMLD